MINVLQKIRLTRAWNYSHLCPDTPILGHSEPTPHEYSCCFQTIVFTVPSAKRTFKTGVAPVLST
jgi:hypothetical protein